MAPPLLLLATGLFVIRLVLFATLHLLPGGVHPLRETVSDYAASPSARTRRIAAAASWTAATAWAALGAGVLSDAALGSRRLGVGVWLIVLGLVVAAMPFVPTDRSGQPATIRGRIHLLLAIGWFTLASSTIGPLGRLLSGTPAFVVGVLDPVAAVSLAALVISMVFPDLRARTFGASERVFILVVTLAPLIAAAALTAR